MTTTTTNDPAVAQLRLVAHADNHVELSIPATSYRLRLASSSPISQPLGKRIPGIVRCNVWKVDLVSAGGDYIEPVFGKPRRIQGHVIAKSADSIVIRVCGTPFLGILSDHCKLTPDLIPIGSRVGMDITGDPSFDPC